MVGGVGPVAEVGDEVVFLGVAVDVGDEVVVVGVGGDGDAAKGVFQEGAGTAVGFVKGFGIGIAEVAEGLAGVGGEGVGGGR